MHYIKLFISFALLGIFLLQAPVSFAKLKPIEIVLDMQNAPKLPKHFRSTKMLKNLTSNINQKGLKDLNILGSGQFSKLAFKTVLEKMDLKKVVVMDLREESHGFLNGNAISWYGNDAAENASKTPEQIEADQAERLQQLSGQETATVYRINVANDKILNAKPIEFAIHDVSAEKAFVEEQGSTYHRLYVQNHYRPKDAEVDRFISIFKSLPANTWVYFHCRAGVGRTTTFMALFDMMHNAKNVSFDEIIARQSALGGSNLSHLPPTNFKKFIPAKTRLQFLNDFYIYAKTNADHFATTWSVWRNKMAHNAAGGDATLADKQ